MKKIFIICRKLNVGKIKQNYMPSLLKSGKYLIHHAAIMYEGVIYMVGLITHFTDFERSMTKYLIHTACNNKDCRRMRKNENGMRLFSRFPRTE